MFKSSIAKNLSLLVSGTVIAQLLVIGFQIVLRRVFTPADFGAFAVYMSLVGILITIATFRYEQTIVLPKEDQKAAALLRLTYVLAFFMGLLSLICIIFLRSYIIQWISFPAAYSNWLYLLPLSLLVFSISQSLNYYLIRDKKFKLSASNKVMRRTGEGLVQSSFGFLGSSIGLVLGDIVGRIVMIIRSIFKIQSIDKKITLNDVKQVAIEYKSFPLKNGIPALFNTFSALLPILFINKIFDEEVTGFFDLARMVLIVPISLITASLSQVLLQSFTEKRNNNQSIKKQALGTGLALMLFAITFALIIYFFGESLFAFVFGKQNGMAGSYASIIVWAFALKFIISPFNIVFTAFNKIGILSVWQLIYFILIVFLLYQDHISIEMFLIKYLFIEILSYSLVGIMSIVTLVKYEMGIK